VSGFCVLVVAKAPVPGRAKTRLCPPASPDQAAEVAAAALLDTLDAVLAVPGARPAVALTGHLPDAARCAELRGLLARTRVLPQRGTGFATRLAAAHADVAALYPGLPVVQIGMDTPQASAGLLAEAADRLRADSVDAVLGPAEDGGWWALGLRDPRAAEALREVPMSTPDTGARTREALRARGLRVGTLPTLSDVDTVADALRVAALAPGGRFARAVAALGDGIAGRGYLPAASAERG
jgi:uncharacterized protein